MIQYGDLNINVDMGDILSLLDEWDAEYFVIKYQTHDPDTPSYMEALPVEHTDEYYDAIDDEIRSITRMDTRKVVSMKSVADKNVLPGT